MSIYTKYDRYAAEGNIDRVFRDLPKGEGRSAIPPIFYRYVVVDTIYDPQTINKEKLDYWQHVVKIGNMEYANVLPRNTIIGKRVYEGLVENPLFLFPFFPSHLAFPCKPGEHVWVMYESPGTIDTNLGYWFCKITEPGFVDDVNHTHAPRVYEASFTPKIKDIYDGKGQAIYEFRNGRADYIDNERYTAAESQVIPGGDELAYEELLTNSDGSQLINYESVPRYRKRPGDMVLEGSNNTVIALGTDRIGSVVGQGFGEESGMIDLVAGRGQIPQTKGNEVVSRRIDKTEFLKELGKSTNELSPQEGDPDLLSDRSRILISQRTSPDRNLGISSYNETNFNDVIDSDNGDGSIIVKSDKIRLIARMDVEILVSGYELDENGKPVSITDPTKYAAVVIKKNGDIVFKPSLEGYIKLGGDDADKGLICSDIPVTAEKGGVSGPPMTTTMGGQFAGSISSGGKDNNGSLSAGQAKYANKVLVK